MCIRDRVVNHVIYADPDNREARMLQADALEQLGYQSESATWRNAYLMGARELRHGTPEIGGVPSHAMALAMEAEHLLGVIGVRLDPAAFTHGPLTINVHFTDLDEDHVLGVGKSAIHERPNMVDPDAAASLRIDRLTFWNALTDVSALDAAEITGDETMVRDLFGALTQFGTAALIEPQTR